MGTTIEIRSVAINAAVLKDKRAAQAHKIRAIKAALNSSGHTTLYRQALALGLCRSTTWNILSGGHKHGGLTADVVNTILSCPTLPDSARLIIHEYVQRKLAGEYGHSADAIARFRGRLLIASSDVRRWAAKMSAVSGC